jgi:hypothetical protein
MNDSLALAAQTLTRVATARQAYVCGPHAPLNIIDHVLVNAVLDAHNAYLQAGGTQDDADALIKAGNAAATKLLGL